MDNKLGPFISLILRHKPETIGIKLDEHGWANVDELIEKINKSGRKIDFETLKYIVETNNKKRYSFNEDKTLIRANQGHSIKVDVELKEAVPPDYLYHGTSTKYLDDILKMGIITKSRLHVHLSKDVETALNVGSRHGEPVILLVDAKAMYDNGQKFYLSENGVWLTANISPQYFKIFNLERQNTER